MKKEIKKRKGFSLLELLVVLTILGILIAIALPNLNVIIGRAQQTADLASAATVQSVVYTAESANLLSHDGTEHFAAGTGEREITDDGIEVINELLAGSGDGEGRVRIGAAPARATETTPAVFGLTFNDATNSYQVTSIDEEDGLLTFESIVGEVPGTP